MSKFTKAERKTAKLRAALCGTSGSGKTYSALLLARGLAGDSGKIAVIDTERGSASLYSDVTDFDVAELAPPFNPRRYRELIAEAARGYDVLVIDSLSHAWTGDGGVLDMHDKASRGGNSYTAWREVTPEHNALVDAILAAPCHIILTMRSKTAYALQENEKGKMTPVKIGLAPIQRDGMEYEFTLVWDLSVEKHVATASKDRTGLWDGRHDVIGIQHGAELKSWLESGKAATTAPPPPPEEIAREDYDGEIQAFTDKTAMRVWLAEQRKANGWKPDHPVYSALKAACTERAQAIDAHAAKLEEVQAADDFDAGLGPVEDLGEPA
ncbi:MAG: AAA family ATPase [Gammaproteobacteria bacterium]|nr:AAA family ATPase [Gammaproteobacteria bacterium]